MPDAAEDLRYFGPRPGWKLVDLREIWRFRELLLVFVQRDLKVRYRQAIVGVAWVIVQPLAALLIFQVFFNLLNRGGEGAAVAPTEADVPYAVSAFCGLLLWQLFATATRDATASLLQHRQMLTKVYFPRLLLPVSSVVGAAFDLLIASSLLLPLMMLNDVTPGWTLMIAPLFVLLAVVSALAAGVWLAALNALYRDIGHVVPFLLQIGFFVSPVVYETSALIPEEWRWVYRLNPIATSIDGLRWSVIGTPPPGWPAMVVSVAIVGALLGGGLMYFNRAEQWIADRI